MMTRRVRLIVSCICLGAVVSLLPRPLLAQQEIGYVDSQYILEQMPEYATVQEKLDRLEKQWEAELQKMQDEVDALFEEYQARELLYTEEERKEKRDQIRKREEQIRQFRQRHFGPEGELYRRQEQLMRPIQERILEAIDAVARTGGYDYIFDKSGDFLFLFARDEHEVSEQVLEELGIDTEDRQ
jgi:outer membrane protein